MSPAASSQEVPANSPGRGWVSVTWCRDAAACFLLGLLLRREPGRGQGDQPLDGRAARTRRPGPRAARPPTGRASNGSERVSAATRRVFHGATSPASTFAHSRGSRCRRSRASAINDIADWVETPIAAPSSSATNAATAGEPSPPSEASQSQSPGRPASPQVAVPVSGWRGAARTTRRRCRSLRCWTIRSSRSASAAAPSRPAVVEVLDLDRRCADCLHGPTQPETTDNEIGPNLVVHKEVPANCGPAPATSSPTDSRPMTRFAHAHRLAAALDHRDPVRARRGRPRGRRDVRVRHPGGGPEPHDRVDDGAARGTGGRPRSTPS